MAGSETDAANEAAAQTLAQRVWFRLEGVAERLKDIVAKMNTVEPNVGIPVARKVINCPDETMTASENGHIQSVKFAISKDARDLIIATVMAASLLTIVILAFLLHDAYKDIQTQVWLRDDALTKFTTGPYADLRAEVKANQIVIATLGAQCLKPK